MNLKRALVTDLDFTLIHLERVPGAIEVPGRTRSAWIAPQTVEVLGELQNRFEIILATARSWEGTQWVCDGLRARGVAIENVVIEDGARLGEIGDLRAFDAAFDAVKTHAILEPRAIWPAFEWQLDFQNCAVARCQTPAEAAQLLPIFAARNLRDARFYRDGRKVYVLPSRADKWSALQKLLGPRALKAAGVGDGENDLVWLRQIALPATFSDAENVAPTVRARGGIVGPKRGHAGIAQVLKQLDSEIARRDAETQRE